MRYKNDAVTFAVFNDRARLALRFIEEIGGVNFSILFWIVLKMDPGYVKADSRNLPDVNHVMVAEFFSKSDLYVSAEIRAVKNQR